MKLINRLAFVVFVLFAAASIRESMRTRKL